LAWAAAIFNRWGRQTSANLGREWTADRPNQTANEINNEFNDLAGEKKDKEKKGRKRENKFKRKISEDDESKREIKEGLFIYVSIDSDTGGTSESTIRSRNE
jgi:hypothetical protein